MKLMKEHGTWYVPTIIAGKFVEEKAKIPGYFPPQVALKAAAVGPLIQGTAGRAYKAGVKIAFGTDAAVYPHGDNGKEFRYMVEGGHAGHGSRSRPRPRTAPSCSSRTRTWAASALASWPIWSRCRAIR